MARIIEFRASEQRLDEVRCSATRESGEIIIFPGVRRARHEAPVEEVRPRKRERGKTKRDRIDLPD